jgi:hypothetical protein
MTEQVPLTIYGEPVRGRSCGSCKACCTQVPVESPLNKPANVRCQHLRAKGCGIYERRPHVCRFWSCRWLFDPATAELRRPDQSGYIIDPMLDTILTDGKAHEVLQIWCDPARRDAHRDPALRAYLEYMVREHGLVAIVRWSSAEGMLLVAPSGSANGEWLEMYSNLNTREEMTAKLAAAGQPPFVHDLDATFAPEPGKVGPRFTRSVRADRL